MTSRHSNSAPWERGLVLTDPRPRSVRDALHEVAHALPDHIAVDDGAQQLTYAEFVRATERVVRVVRATAPDHEPVTVVVAHGVDALVAIVGVIVSGRIAVPVDRHDPVERLCAVHQEAGSSLIVSDPASEDVARAVAPDGPVVVLDDPPLRSGTEPADDATSPGDEITIDPDSLAILFFTSGSTGAPKGVPRTHHNAVLSACRFAYWLGLTPVDRIGFEGSFSFSAAYSRVWTALLNGVTLCLYDVKREGARGIAAWANESGITITGFIPSVFRALAAAAPEARMDSVRLVTFGGESLFGRDVRRARRMFGPDTEFRNRLASTEAGTACKWVVTPDDEVTDAPVPIGYAEPWLELRIVDGDGNDVPNGETGMLVVIDINLSVGYWRDPELTAERFFDLPDGRRAFRTSDRVRMRSDGVLEHLGRGDDRAKVRGAMTSPSEVERALVELDDIADAVVVGTPTPEGGTRLVAYVVPQGRVTPSGWQVRRDLAERVRPHMVPSVVIVLDAFPVGPRGKIDRVALPPPPDPAPRPYREPVGRERELAGLYMQVLGLDRVGLDDDFFELGGDSLAVVELIAAIDDHFGVELSAPVLLESPTVAGLAPRLVRQRARSAPTVVQLRHSDAGTPFFCVAGGGSPATSLRALAEFIEDRPCYGIQARGLEERARPDRSVEACARRYLAEIRAIQPSGPYLFGGFSFGTLVAYEMACQLRSVGERVALLAIIDTIAPGRKPNAATRRATRLEGTSLGAKLRKVPRAITGRAQLSFELASAGLLRRRLRQYRVFFLLSRRAGERYQPSARFNGPALVVRASIPDADVLRPEEPDLGWGPFLGGPVTTTEVTGDHLGIMRRPYVTTLGRELGRALDDHSAGG